MAKFKPLRRALKKVRKKNHSARDREAYRTTSNSSHRWISAIWPRRRSARTTNGAGLPRRSRRFLPSFSCFKKKKKSLRRSVGGFGRDSGRGGRMLRLVSSFLKRRDEPTCTQDNFDEDTEANPHDSYILSMGGINILVEPYYHPTDHTAAGSTRISCYQIDYTAADRDSLMSSEPDTAATSQNVDEVISNITSPVSCTSEELSVSADVTPLDWESSLESLISSESHSFYEIKQYQPEVRQSLNRQKVKYQRREGDDETIFQMEQSIAKIERISHQFCYPNRKRSSGIKQDYKVAASITCTWQWITAVSMVFLLILMM